MQLAPDVGAGKFYEGVWHVTAFGGTVWLAVMVLVLALAGWSLHKQAFPKKLVHEEEDEDEDEDEDDERPRRRRRRRDSRDFDDPERG